MASPDLLAEMVEIISQCCAGNLDYPGERAVHVLYEK